MKLVIGYTCYKEKEIELTPEQEALWKKYEDEWAEYDAEQERARENEHAITFANDPYGGETENAIRKFAEDELFKDNTDNIVEVTGITNPETDETIYMD